MIISKNKTSFLPSNMPAPLPAWAPEWPQLAPAGPPEDTPPAPEPQLAPEVLRPRARAILAARDYALHRRHQDLFPALFAFGDVVELELAPGPAAAARGPSGGVPAGDPALAAAAAASPARLGVPAVVVDVLDDNWLRLLVPARWAGASEHHIFHVRTWNVAMKPEWAAAPRAELRDTIFGSFVLYLAVLASAAFEDHDLQHTWHVTLKPHLSEVIHFDHPWDQQFISSIDSAVVYSWDC